MEATATRTRKRQRLTAGERQAMQAEALDRAKHGRTCGNDLLIITAFSARGINAQPRVDCFTFNAWRALGRHVRKGEHGVHVPVYAHVEDVDQETGAKTEHTIPTGATVFHISQTDPDEASTTPPAAPRKAAPVPVVVDLRHGECYKITPTADPYRPIVEQERPLTPQEQDTLDNIEATQRQDLDADNREQAEDDHEAAILEQEQREEASYTGPAYVIEDPLTGSVIGHSPAKTTTTADNQPVLFT